MTDENLAMQTRCVHCLCEQYASNVHAVSLGETGCTWCGKTSTPMTREEYWKTLAIAYANAQTVLLPRQRSPGE